MSDLSAQRSLSAAPVSAAALVDSSMAPRQKPARLSQSALDVVANEPREAAYSPIVVSGFVRAIEFVLIIVVGITVYIGYLWSQETFAPYGIATLMIASLCVLAFQSVELYEVY